MPKQRPVHMMDSLLQVAAESAQFLKHNYQMMDATESVQFLEHKYQMMDVP